MNFRFLNMTKSAMCSFLCSFLARNPFLTRLCIGKYTTNYNCNEILRKNKSLMTSKFINYVFNLL